MPIRHAQKESIDEIVERYPKIFKKSNFKTLQERQDLQENFVATLMCTHIETYTLPVEHLRILL